MSLLNNLVGALAGRARGNGGLGQLAELATSNPAILQAAAGLLGGGQSGGQSGGLAEMLGQLQSAGLGDIAESWVGTGDNQAVEPSQIEAALGSDAISNFASQAGVAQEEAPNLLAQLLPEMIDKLTPQGSAEDAGADSADNIMSLLGNVLGR